MLRKTRQKMTENKNQNNNMADVQAKPNYFDGVSDLANKLRNKYHAVVLIKGAKVVSDPVFLQSKRTTNKFAKFTIEFESPIPWIMKKDLPSEQRGDVFVDCLAFENKKDAPGAFVLQNIRKGAIISCVAIMKSGHKPVKNEGDEYRANWVYGDYIYLNIYDVKIDREAPPDKPNSPYKNDIGFSPYYKSPTKEQVADEDIIFNL